MDAQCTYCTIGCGISENVCAIIFMLAWIVTGFISYGITFGYFQKKFPLRGLEGRSADKKIAWVVALTGPIGMIVAIFKCEKLKYGLRWK